MGGDGLKFMFLIVSCNYNGRISGPFQQTFHFNGFAQRRKSSDVNSVNVSGMDQEGRKILFHQFFQQAVRVELHAESTNLNVIMV